MQQVSIYLFSDAILDMRTRNFTNGCESTEANLEI